MKTITFVFVLVGIFCAGCDTAEVFSRALPVVDVEIINQSSRDLLDAEAQFGDYVCGWGIVGQTFTKSYLHFPYPITSVAELRWGEEGLGQRLERIELTAIYPQRADGRLTFLVTDTGVSASFRTRQ